MIQRISLHNQYAKFKNSYIFMEMPQYSVERELLGFLLTFSHFDLKVIKVGHIKIYDGVLRTTRMFSFQLTSFQTCWRAIDQCALEFTQRRTHRLAAGYGKHPQNGREGCVSKEEEWHN